MLNFSTEIPIDPKVEISEVLSLAIEWVTGSPHVKIARNAFDGYERDTENRYTFQFEGTTVDVTIIHTSTDDSEIAALKHVRVEPSGLQWTSTMVATKSAQDHVIGFQVTCEAMNTAVRLPAPKKPYFIRQTLERLGGGMDGQIPVADQPFILAEGEEHIAAALINGTAKNRLPIVYVSVGFEDEYSINPQNLAQLVSGTAHVIVEPSRDFSLRLKGLVNGRNVFGGTVAIYWPESFARRSYYLGAETPNAKAIEVRIASDIRLALSNRRLRSQCTWSYVSEVIAKKRFDQLRKQGSTELMDYIEVFDREQKAKDERIQDYEDEITRLNAEVLRLSFSQLAQGDGLLVRGKEQDFYEGEIADIVVDCLRSAQNNVMRGSRRGHIIQDVIEANPQVGKAEKYREDIKQILNSYTNMDARTKSGLLALGFRLSEDGKHIKAVFNGDGRYTFSLPKSGSDHRGGKNIASDINKTLF